MPVYEKSLLDVHVYHLVHFQYRIGAHKRCKHKSQIESFVQKNNKLYFRSRPTLHQISQLVLCLQLLRVALKWTSNNVF